MDEKKFKLCRLCLNAIQGNDSVDLDTVSKNILLILIPGLNLELTDDPKICTSCNLTMMSYYDFKNKSNEKILYIKGKSKDDDVDDERQCFFCQKEIALRSTVTTEAVKAVLRNCFSNWKMFAEEVALTCNNCLDSMKNFWKFIRGILDTEKKIKAFSDRQGTDGRGKINLYEALEFISDSDKLLQFPERSAEVVIKTEVDENEVLVKVEDLKELPEDSEMVIIKTEIDEDIDFQLENEAIDIKVEELERDLHEGRFPEEETLDDAPSTSRITIDEPTRHVSNRKRPPITVPAEATTSKQLKMGQKKPETRSIGIQVNMRDLIAHFNMGIQTDFAIIKKDMAISAKPSVCTLKGRAKGLTEGSISKGKKSTVKKRGRKVINKK